VLQQQRRRDNQDGLVEGPFPLGQEDEEDELAREPAAPA
jgi:hypothetical protein